MVLGRQGNARPCVCLQGGDVDHVVGILHDRIELVRHSTGHDRAFIGIKNDRFAALNHFRPAIPGCIANVMDIGKFIMPELIDMLVNMFHGITHPYIFLAGPHHINQLPQHGKHNMGIGLGDIIDTGPD